MPEPQILKQTDDFLVLNKPAGLVVHADGRTDEPTLCDWLLKNFPEIFGVGEPLRLKGANGGATIDRPGIVHRLDRDTSGVMVVARTQEAFEYLKQQFKDRKVEKTYEAFVYGNIKEDEFTVDEPIGRSKKDFRRWFSGKDAGIRGKTRDAVTDFRVLARSKDKSATDTATLVEARPKTGRTHQIRVHLKSIYNPIVADNLYAPDREPILGFKRLALHAKSLRFTDLEGKEVFVESPDPADFEHAKTLL
jgi:23S rRNA pseudouridine1911/1915/1917 synthase